ncbi:MAG TPA: ABC transporter ATP-binding protein [Firmicutes bacterium]|jgi:ABC-2 type transport system ATP-binding protein|nr:ABC transporter ATP-binding protein [Bacillota bacterium]
MLVLKDVNKTYDGKKMAVKELNLKVNAGEIFGFIGPNGAGKTTTIKMITGLLPPTSGRILLNGIDLATLPVEAKRNFTYVPDHPEIFTGLKGIEYLNFLADMYEVPGRERRNRIEKYTRLFAIDTALGDLIQAYSHGMKQKLLICGALLPQAPLFILDEPLVGLDPLATKHLKDIMREHCAAGGTVFFSSHLLAVVDEICDRIGLINQGELIVCDRVERIKNGSAHSLEDIFLELTKDGEG